MDGYPILVFIVWLMDMLMFSGPYIPEESTIKAAFDALFNEWFKKLSSYFYFTFLRRDDVFYGAAPCDIV